MMNILSWLRPRPKPDPIGSRLAGEITNHNELDKLCAVHGGTYERTRDEGGTVRLSMRMPNGAVYVGEGKTTPDALAALTKSLEHLR